MGTEPITPTKQACLADVLGKIALHLETPIWIEIIRRGEGNVVTHKASVPIRMVKPDYDGKGVAIRIEESEIVFEEFR